MKSFPKKYDSKDLKNRSKFYKWSINSKKTFDNSNTTFSTNIISCSEKISYNKIFQIYLNDFFNCKNIIDNKQSGKKLSKTYEQLFIISWNEIQDIQSNFEFFSKKNQTLLKIWVNKLEKRIISSNKKCINRNNKIIDSYSSSNHKIYIPDFNLYIYILEQFQTLRDKWKIREETKIWYWSFNLQTSIPSENITRVEEKTPYYILKYFVWAKCEALPIYVEDIDSCCGDVGLLVHPKDKRYNKYIWKNAIIPLCNRQIPIIWDENVNIALNNWIKRICPCSDEESITLAKNLGLPTDIYVFNKEWLYTPYIHEKAFIWKNRDKYYNNIIWFIEDIWNLSKKWEKIIKKPYLKWSNERLIPYKMNQIIIDIEEEKEKILNKILNKSLQFPFLDENLWEHLSYNSDSNREIKDTNIEYEESESTSEYNDTNDETIQIRQKIIDEINQYLPKYIICNTQIPYLWRLPLIKDSNKTTTFFNIEKEYSTRKEKPLQKCFNLILLFLVRSGSIWTKFFWDNEMNSYKLCEYNKLPAIISENEKKIEYIIQYLTKKIWKNPEFNEILEIINNITNENNSTLKSLIKLIDNSKFLEHEWERLSINIKWIRNDAFDWDFIQSCIPCYLKNKNVDINNQIIFSENERKKIFKDLLIQELLLWETIYTDFIESSYEQKKEYLWKNNLTKFQIEQSQRDLFYTYWENPIRLCLLCDKTLDQKEILLNNIFLKQIRNATRLCIQKDFLPEDIENTLKEQPKNFNDFDIFILNELNESYYNRKNLKTYEEYIKFFKSFKNSIQDIFFSRYLEIQKINQTKNVQFVCSYFLNFLLTTLYPLVPEFVNALQYISERNFLNPIKPLKLNDTTNYNMHILYSTFRKIKEMKIEYNIKQHEYCNIFIKSTPTIWNIFSENEQIFRNYFHISDISYIRLHEANPLWYEIFSDDIITLWIQTDKSQKIIEKDSLDNIEKEIKNLDDKLILLRQRIQILPEWEERSKVEEEYAKTKEEIENLTIKHSLLINK